MYMYLEYINFPIIYRRVKTYSMGTLSDASVEPGGSGSEPESIFSHKSTAAVMSTNSARLRTQLSSSVTNPIKRQKSSR